MKRTVVISLGVIAVTAALAGAVYAYDASRSDLIAEGVTVAGIDVSGMSVARVRAALEARLASRIERPVIVGDGTHRWVLSATAAAVEVDVQAMAQAALGRSRSGSFITRAFRDLTGGRIRAAVPLRVSYSSQAVSALVRRVERTLETAPQEAKVVASPTALRTVPSTTGRAVRTDELARSIRSRFQRPNATRVVSVPTRVLTPATTSAELPDKYPYFITISRSRFELRLFERLRLVKVYPISVGRIGYETPAGLYRIHNKAADPAWYVPNKPWAGELAGKIIPPGPDNPIKARWLGIYDGVGIHGTAEDWSIGHPASHGCIRMRIRDVIGLYEKVPVDTPVFIG